MCFITGLLKPKYQEIAHNIDVGTTVFDVDQQELFMQEELQSSLLPAKMVSGVR